MLAPDLTRGISIVACIFAFACGAQAQGQDVGAEKTGRGSHAYPIVDTGQTSCYGSRGGIAFPKKGQPFFGQDAQYESNPPSYRDNGDGTITDLVTGLEWQKTPDFQTRTWEEAGEYAKGLQLAGHDDWRLPTIKELFSIADFRGNMHTRTPYVDTKYFDFEYPDPSTGMRDMDAQYWSGNRYVGTTMRGDESAFGFNFADGRIKSYPIRLGGRPGGPGGRGDRGGGGGPQIRKYVRCVRGAAYGKNDFVDNGDGTVTDRATGLMWMKADSKKAMNWQDALAHAEGMVYAGHDDWRLPDVKELQSIVDYSRAPDARSPSARSAAIDPVFEVAATESWYWSGTTHIENGFGYYVCFGQAFSAWKWQGKQMNAHGAGAVRSDPKTGDPADYADGLGPQGDEIRILNHVRCVRGGKVKLRTTGPPPDARQPDGGAGAGRRFIQRLDTDGDGKVSLKEFDGPERHFKTLDRDGDGFLDESEAPKGPPPRNKRR